MPTSVNPDELCVNGMSFSKRQSKWANSALVVTIDPTDMTNLVGSDLGPLIGVRWQQVIERKAALMGGGNLVAPVQRVKDFMAKRTGNGVRPIISSYRLGVKEAPCHEIYPEFVNEALCKALLDFERAMPGFICDGTRLYGVNILLAFCFVACLTLL